MKYANWDDIDANTHFPGADSSRKQAFDLFVKRRFRRECARFFVETQHLASENRMALLRLRQFRGDAGLLGVYGLDASSEDVIPDWAVEYVRSRLRFIRDWAVSAGARQVVKLPKMTFSAAYGRAEQWHRRVERQTAEKFARARRFLDATGINADDVVREWDPAATYGNDDIIRFGDRLYFGYDIEHIRAVAALPVEPVGEGERLELDDGWYWTRLATMDALRQESRRLGHCVGYGAYAHYIGDPCPVGIWSLRRGNDSYATVEISHSLRNPSAFGILQAKGPRNRYLPEKHRRRLKTLRDAYDVEPNTESLTRAEIKEIYGETHPLGIVPTPDADVDDDCGIGGL